MALEQPDEFIWPPAQWAAQWGQAGAPAPALDPSLVAPPPLQLGPDEQIAETQPLQAGPAPLPGPMSVDIPLPGPMPVDAVSGVGEVVPQMPPVDAISGVGPILPQIETGEFAEPQIPVEQADPVDPTFIDPLAPSSWGKPMSSDDLREMASRDPVGFAEYSATVDQTRADEQRRREQVAATENASREELNHRDLMDSMAKANEMQQKLLETRVDPTRWHSTRSPLQSIAAMISVVVGGLVQARKGGSNIGLDIIDKAIDRDIAEQQANIANQRNAIGDLRAQGMSDFQAKQAYRIAWYQKAKDDVLTSMQDYAPDGTTARNHAKQAMEIEGRIASAAEAGRRQTQAEDMAKRKEARDTIDLLSQIRKRDAETAKLQGAMARAGGLGASTVKPGNLTGEEVTQMIASGGGSKVVPDKPGGYTSGEARGHVDLAATVTKQERESRSRYVGGIVDKEGKPFEFASPEEGEKFRAKIAATSELNQLIGKLARDVNEHGGTIGFFNTGLNKKYNARLGQIAMALKGTYGTGTIDKGTTDLFDKMMGDPIDPLRGGTEGLDELRDGLVQRVNIELKTQPGYDGPGFNPTYTPRLPRAAQTDGDKAIDRVIKANYLPAQVIDKVVKGGGFGFDIDRLGSKEATDVELERLEREANRTDGGVAQAKERAVAVAEKEKLEREIKKDGASADADERMQAIDAQIKILAREEKEAEAAPGLAKKNLKAIADKAIHPAVKKRAGAILDALPRPRESGDR